MPMRLADAAAYGRALSATRGAAAAAAAAGAANLQVRDCLSAPALSACLCEISVCLGVRGLASV